jgi:hypothetical protein
MKLALAFPLVAGGLAALAMLVACSSGSSAPDGVCRPSDPSCNPTSTVEAGVPVDAATEAQVAPPTEASTTPDACHLWVDDSGVTQGCGSGGMGPGDRDDGGGSAAPPPPDAALDASNLPFGASCWDNVQCASDLCFDYKVRGTFCSRICMTNIDCPPPSPGCNGMGVCRMADMGSPDGG